MADGERKAAVEHVVAEGVSHKHGVPATRLLGAVGVASLTHLTCALLLLAALGGGRPGAVPAVVSIVAATAAVALLVATRARHAGLDVATRHVPAVFGVMPLFASVAIALPWVVELSPDDLRTSALGTIPVLAATTASGVAIALVLEYSLWAVGARIGAVAALARRAAGRSPADASASSPAPQTQRAPPSLAGRLARLVAGLGVASALLVLAAVLTEFDTAQPWSPPPQTWLVVAGVAITMVLAVLAAISAGLSPGRDVVTLAARLDAIGWDDDPSSSGSGTASRPLADPVRVTSFDVVGELFGNLERLRARLAEEVGTYQRALDRTHAADVAKREFLAAVSHELRTPLDSIHDHAERLLASELSEAQAEDIRLILAGGAQLRELIEDILDISMIESGELELRFAACNVVELVEGLVDIHRAQVRGPGVELVSERHGAIPLVSCDRKRVGQVLTNLLSNAIKFTEAGHVGVSVRHSPSPAPAQIQIVVSDTGIGIAATELTAIFEEYEQVGTRKRKLKGTGLGLAIARRIAEAHGGSLVAASVLGVGSTFTLELPLIQAASELERADRAEGSST